MLTLLELKTLKTQNKKQYARQKECVYGSDLAQLGLVSNCCFLANPDQEKSAHDRKSSKP